MEITLAEKKDKCDWDNFLKEHQESTFFHSFWYREIIEETYGKFEPLYLIARDNNKVVGILPAFRCEFGKYFSFLLSNPFYPYGLYGGPIANSSDITDAMLSKAEGVAEDNGCIEIDISPIPAIHNQIDILIKRGYNPRKQLGTQILSLKPSLDELFNNYDMKARSKIRQAIKKGVAIVESDDKEDAKECFNIYHERMKEKWSASTLTSKFFDKLWAGFPDFGTALMAMNKNETIAFTVILYAPFSNTALYFINSSISEYHSLRPNDLLINEAIKIAKERNMEWFDFMFSMEKPTADFKSKFSPNVLDWTTYYKTIRKLKGIQANVLYRAYSTLKPLLPENIRGKILGD